MIISIGSDHGGFELKKIIVEYLKLKKINVIDHGCYDKQSVDYPVYANLVCRDIMDNRASFGMLICTTGIGMSIAANKFNSIRAALIDNIDAAIMTRKHNDSNCLCLGSRYIDDVTAKDIVDAFINTAFEGGRHQRRVDMLAKMNNWDFS